MAVAAAFVKCGFEIDWIDNRVPHPEFVARNKRTGEQIAVETKSRHRKGALHEEGVLLPEHELRVDVQWLYREALKQDPKDLPFAVFLDLNLPPHTARGEVAKWQNEVVQRWKETNDDVALIGFTNFAWHYRPGDVTLGPEFLLAIPLEITPRPLRRAETFHCLRAVLETYGIPANEY